MENRRHRALRPLHMAAWKHPNSCPSRIKSKSYPKLLGESVTATGYEVLIRLREAAGYSPRIFTFKRFQPSRMVKLLCEIYHYFPFCLLLDLILFSPLAECDLPDLALYGYHLDSSSLSYSAACSSALEQLAQHTGAPAISGIGTGTITEEGWMRPNLLYIELRIPEDEEPPALRVAALLSLVRKRWSGADSGLAPATRPDRFEIGCTLWSYTKLTKVEKEVQWIAPRFAFRLGG